MAMLTVVALFTNTVCAFANEESELEVIWEEPTPEQIEEAIKNRMPLPEEDFSIMASRRAYERLYGSITYTVRPTLNRMYNPIGNVSATNRTGSPTPLSYTQAQTKTTTWNVTASVSGEAEVGTRLIASIKATVGGSVGASWTTQRGRNFSYSSNISPGKTGQRTA